MGGSKEDEVETKEQAVNSYWSSLNTLLAGWIRGQSHSVTGDCHETISPKKKKTMLKIEYERVEQHRKKMEEEQAEERRRKIEEEKTVESWKKMEEDGR